MKKQTISRDALTQFSSFSAAFGNQQSFAPFLEQPFAQLSDLQTQIAKKKQVYSQNTRQILSGVLQQQLGGIASLSQKNNIELLQQSTTFTVTTGHQLTLFAGPMYLLYKVLHVVKLAQEFNESQQENKLVPVFWMASEDHDLDEVRSAHLFNKKLIWETPQQGAVGSMKMDDFHQVHSDFASFFEDKKTAIETLLKIPLKESYGTYIQAFLSSLFAELGVLVIQPNDPQLKALAKPFFTEELLHSKAIRAVEKTNKEILSQGFKPQAVPREINLFYLKEQARVRIERVSSGFAIDGTIFTEAELFNELDKYPERFSPNVILRPVYQETILPNLAYIGGGGEMAYWIQLKQVFEVYNTQFPLLQQRVSLHLIDGATKKKMEKTGLEVASFFQSKENLRKSYMQEHAGDEVNFAEVSEAFHVFKERFIGKAKSIEPVLESMVEAEMARIEKQREALEQRIVKQVKHKHEVALSAIDFVVDKFIPENTLQERYFHWGQFVPSGDFHEFLMKLLHEIDPFEKDLIVLDLSE